MAHTSRFSKRFAAAALAGALTIGFGLACAGCSRGKATDWRSEEAQQNTAIQKLEASYPTNTRMQEILEDQKNYTIDAERVDFLISNKIALDISSAGLPQGAAIRLFEHRWQINPFLTAGQQGWALNCAIVYAQGQAKDGMPFGMGESFSVVGGSFSPIGQIPAEQQRTIEYPVKLRP